MKPEFAVSLTVAVSLHALLIFSIRFEPPKAAGKTEDGLSMNVSLVEAAPASAPARADSTPVPEPFPVPEPPLPVVEPAPTPSIADMPPPAPEQDINPVVATAAESAPPKPRAKQRSSPPVSKRSTASSSSSSALAPSAGNKAGASPNLLPRYRSNPRPEYPADARRMRQQGLVMLSVKVSATGRPIDVTLKRSSGYPSLDEAAIRAVRRWTFDPATVGGMAVASEVDVPVRFALEQTRR